MPSFTVQVPNLQALGPIVEVQVTVGTAVEQALRAAGQLIPSPVKVLAQIDTGATGSVLQAGLPAQLNLTPVGMTAVNTPSSTNVQCPEYLVRFVFPNNVLFETTNLEAPLAGQSIQGLIGRDVLAQAVLVYIGYNNQVTIRF
jgi:hypothetical protein